MCIIVLGGIIVVETIYILELKQQARELYDEYCEQIKKITDGETSNDF
jgi:hypothetical protein